MHGENLKLKLRSIHDKKALLVQLSSKKRSLISPTRGEHKN